MPKKIDHVGPQEKGKKNTPVSKTPLKPAATDGCHWNGQQYDEGGLVCFNHEVLQCIRTIEGHEWFPNGDSC
jgi:hypothetical protein